MEVESVVLVAREREGVVREPAPGAPLELDHEGEEVARDVLRDLAQEGGALAREASALAPREEAEDERLEHLVRVRVRVRVRFRVRVRVRARARARARGQGKG